MTRILAASALALAVTFPAHAGNPTPVLDPVVIEADAAEGSAPNEVLVLITALLLLAASMAD